MTIKEKVTSSSIDSDKQNFDKIKLDIYLNVICNWCDKIYEFMRGNDVVSTKRYKVLYCVNVKL